MAVSYKKLLHLLIDREISTSDLQKQAGFSANITMRIKRNNYISMETVENICRTLDCGVDEILEFIPECCEVKE